MSVQLLSFENREKEKEWIADKIKQDINLDTETVAIIARKHKELEEIATSLQEVALPVIYERKENVLELPHIIWIINIFRFINSLRQSYADDLLLLEIISYPFWELESLVIYDISRKSYENKSRWLDVMLEYKCSFYEEDKNEVVSQRVRNIAKFLIELSKHSVSMTVEQVLDWVLGLNQEGEYELDFRKILNQNQDEEEENLTDDVWQQLEEL